MSKSLYNNWWSEEPNLFFIRELNVFCEEKNIGEKAALVKELPEDCGPEEDSSGGGDPGGAVAAVAVADALVGLGTKGVAALAVVHLAVEGGLEAARPGVVLVAAGVL